MYNGNYSMWQINNYIWEIAQENFGISPYEFSPINIFNEDYYQNNDNPRNSTRPTSTSKI